MPKASSAVLANQFRSVNTDVVEEIAFGLESIEHLTHLVAEECGQTGEHLYFAIGKLAHGLAKLARDSVEAAALKGGAE